MRLEQSDWGQPRCWALGILRGAPRAEHGSSRGKRGTLWGDGELKGGERREGKDVGRRERRRRGRIGVRLQQIQRREKQLVKEAARLREDKDRLCAE